MTAPLTAERLAEIRLHLTPHPDEHRVCWRIGGNVTLENGVCPECGWSVGAEAMRRIAKYDPHGIVQDLLAEVDRLRQIEAAARAVNDAVTRAGAAILTGACVTGEDPCDGLANPTAREYRQAIRDERKAFEALRAALGVAR